MVRLQSLSLVGIGSYRCLIYNLVCCCFGGICNLCVGNQHLVARCFSVPGNLGIGIARVNADGGNLLLLRLVFNCYVVNIEQVFLVKIAHKGNISTVSLIGGEIHNILYKLRCSPYRNSVHRYKSSDILCIGHDTDDETMRIGTSGVFMHSTPETNLALVEREVRIGRIRQCRSYQIGIFTGRDSRRGVVCTGEDHRHRGVLGIKRTVCLALVSVDKGVVLTGIATPCPLEVTV